MSQCVHVIKTYQHTHTNTKSILMLQESGTVDGGLAGGLGSLFTFFFSAHGGSSPWLSLFMSTNEICAIVSFYMIMSLAFLLTFPLRFVSWNTSLHGWPYSHIVVALFVNSSEPWKQKTYIQKREKTKQLVRDIQSPKGKTKKKKTTAPKAIKLVLHLPVKGEQKQFNTESPKGKTKKENKSPRGYQKSRPMLWSKFEQAWEHTVIFSATLVINSDHSCLSWSLLFWQGAAVQLFQMLSAKQCAAPQLHHFVALGFADL